jgi:hypothetical protein
VAKDEGNPLPRTEVREPVPGEHALGGHHEILAVRSDELEECLRVGAEVLVDLDVSGLIENTDVEGSGVKIDAAVVEVLLGIESHRGLLLEGWLPPPSILAEYAEEEASISITALQPTRCALR